MQERFTFCLANRMASKQINKAKLSGRIYLTCWHCCWKITRQVLCVRVCMYVCTCVLRPKDNYEWCSLDAIYLFCLFVCLFMTWFTTGVQIPKYSRPTWQRIPGVCPPLFSQEEGCKPVPPCPPHLNTDSRIRLRSSCLPLCWPSCFTTPQVLRGEKKHKAGYKRGKINQLVH